MSIIKLDVIKEEANINSKQFPMFSGFITANQLKEIAVVPSFGENKSHHQIASDIANPPVDQWQRPLDLKKTNKIKDTYSRTDKDNLMANPILIGIATPNINLQSYVDIIQKTVVAFNGQVIPIEKFYEVSINYSKTKKPLWILDGQHRIEGMAKSSQSQEPIPFVLLYDTIMYTPPFLAEIFTQVTTGATPMEVLHAEWMKYAFRLDYYSQEVFEKSMSTTIYLCKEIKFGVLTNPLHNKIKFNPYLSEDGYYAFMFDMVEWVTIVSENYYSRGGSLEPKDLAEEIVKIITAMRELDSFKLSTSKLFSNDNPHKILAEGFISGILKYLVDNKPITKSQWKILFDKPELTFSKCDWSLPFVKTTGSLSSGYGKPSKDIAKACFNVAFNSVSAMKGTMLTDYLNGVNAKIKITAYTKTDKGKINTKNAYYSIINPGGLNPFNTSNGSIKRDYIRVEANSSNCHILRVYDDSVKPPKVIKAALTKTALDISSYKSGKELFVDSMSYSGDTVITTRIRIDK